MSWRARSCRALRLSGSLALPRCYLVAQGQAVDRGGQFDRRLRSQAAVGTHDFEISFDRAGKFELRELNLRTGRAPFEHFDRQGEAIDLEPHAAAFVAE